MRKEFNTSEDEVVFEESEPDRAKRKERASQISRMIEESEALSSSTVRIPKQKKSLEVFEEVTGFTGSIVIVRWAGLFLALGVLYYSLNLMLDFLKEDTLTKSAANVSSSGEVIYTEFVKNLSTLDPAMIFIILILVIPVAAWVASTR